MTIGAMALVYDVGGGNNNTLNDFASESQSQLHLAFTCIDYDFF